MKFLINTGFSQNQQGALYILVWGPVCDNNDLVSDIDHQGNGIVNPRGILRGHRRSALSVHSGAVDSWRPVINSCPPGQNGRLFADDTFNRIFMNENVRIAIEISLKFVPKDPINNIPALIQIMAWRRSGDKPLSEPMMDNLLVHILVSRPQ